MKKVNLVDDIVHICAFLPHLKEMELKELEDYLNPEEDDDWGGWYWDEDKKELFHPYIVLSDPGYDMLFIMKDAMTKDDEYPKPEIINFVFGQEFYLKGYEDWSKDKLFNTYIDVK